MSPKNRISILSHSNKGVAFLIALILAYLSGWRDVGFDRENYIAAVYNIRATDDLNLKLIIAKDIGFLLINNLANFFSEDVRLVFLILCSIALISKYFAVKKIAPDSMFIFIFLYAIFLSPGLEFAAMRSGLAIGFLLLSLAFYDRIWLFYIFLILSIMSHISMLPVALLMLPKINKFLSSHKFGYLLLAILTASLGSIIIVTLPQGAVYEKNFGTIFAYFHPITTLIIALMVFYRQNSYSNYDQSDTESQFMVISKPLVFGLIAISFGITSFIVTAGTRYLEIAWCLLLLNALIMWKKSILNLSAILCLLSYLAYINIYRSTWIALFL